MTTPLKIWAVADNRRGVENQALGLAEAIALECGGDVQRALIREDGFVTLPDSERPDVWIGCGRPAIRTAQKHRAAFSGTRFVYVQDPRGHYDLFDAVVSPEHDRLKHPNTISMIGSPNRLSPEKLVSGSHAFDEKLSAFPEPRIAMLVGGPNKRLKVSDDAADSIAARAEAFLAEGKSLLITTSRRTPKPLTRRLIALGEHPRCWIHTGEGENPYFAFLGAADWLFVTEDSTNMLTEAAFTGKPVYSLPLEGNPGKFRHLHASLEAYGALRPFLGRLDNWTYVRLDETARVARLLTERFNLKEIAT